MEGYSNEDAMDTSSDRKQVSNGYAYAGGNTHNVQDKRMRKPL